MSHRHLFTRTIAITLVLGGLIAAATSMAATMLDPTTIPKFTDPLPLPATLMGMSSTAASPLVITMSEFQQQILPPSFYPPAFAAGTYVWGYNGTYPGPTIASLRGTPTHVKYINNLASPTGGPLFLQNTILCDQTIHWANPLGLSGQTDPYLGPVPACVHLHGGEVPSAYDGGPEAWWTPGFAQMGTGFVTDQVAYPNQQEATTLFYHDHALGMTRLNVYAGLAAFYLLLDPALEAHLPGGSADTPADQYGNPYQRGVAIQDRMFDTDGQLMFPAAGINPEHPFWIPEFFGNVVLVNGKPWPYLQVEPRRYRFRMLNGSNARFYRMKLANLDLGTPGPAMWQIGSDGGLLDGPVKLADPAVHDAPRLIMASGERADLIIDFSGYEGQKLTILNDASAPFPDGDPVDGETSVIMQFQVGTTVTGGADPTYDPSLGGPLRAAPIERPTPPPVTRALTLNEVQASGGPLEMFVNNTMWDMTPSEVLNVGDTEVWEIINLTMDTHPMHLHLFQYQMLNRQPFDAMSYKMEYGMPMDGMGPPLGYNALNAATGFKLGGNPDVTPFLLGIPQLPDPNERGWKDTFRMNPGEVTRVLVRVAPQDADGMAAALSPPQTVAPGLNLFPFEPWVPKGYTDSFGFPGGPGYVWHCHIVDHEDNEMMRPLMVGYPTGPTATLVTRFDAEPAASGVRVIWELSNVAHFTATTVERAKAEVGPWSAISGTRSQDGLTTIMTDASAAAGSTYWYRLLATKSDGTTMTFGPVISGAGSALSFSLSAVSPNPTRGPIGVDFSLPSAASVQLKVLDVQGRDVATLASGSWAAGRYHAAWDGAGKGGRVPAGLYFVRYQVGGQVATRRVAIAR